MASTIPAVNISKPKGVLAKNGIVPPKALCKGCSIKSLTQNLKTNKAHRP